MTIRNQELGEEQEEWEDVPLEDPVPSRPEHQPAEPVPTTAPLDPVRV